MNSRLDKTPGKNSKNLMMGNSCLGMPGNVRMGKQPNIVQEMRS